MLILGSLPGDASLAAQQYYAHPRNRFWQLAGAVIGADDLPALPYPARLVQLVAAGIGLWDVLASAERPGSLDTAIRAGTAADLPALAGALPQLRAIAFNGAKAAQLGRRALGGGPWALIDLPSSSPANAAVPLAAKHERWIALRKYLNPAPPIDIEQP